MQSTCVMCHNDFELEEIDRGLCEECIERVRNKVGDLYVEPFHKPSRSDDDYSPIREW